MTEGVLGVLAGVLLGGVYFGGLLLTVRALGEARRPALLVLASYGGRLSLMGAGLVAVAPLGGGALAGALLGVVTARGLLVRRFGPAGPLPARDGDRSGGIPAAVRPATAPRPSAGRHPRP